MNPAESHRTLGLDIGDVRTGVAVSDELGWTARPLLTLPTQNLTAALPELLRTYDVRRVVVGRPRSLDGSLGAQADKIEEVVDWLRAEIPVEFSYEDETATTAEAPGGTDEAAACVMLQGYLDEAT